MTLALRLGRTVGELLDSLSAAELMLWHAYDADSPLSDQRGDIQAGLIASSVFQAQGHKVNLQDMLPDWGAASEPEDSWERVLRVARGAR